MFKFLQGFKMYPFIRTGEELFNTTIQNYYTSSKDKNFFIINANFYDLTTAGKIDVFNGNDPIEADNTLPIGHVIQNKRIVTGSAAPLDFYIAFFDTKEYKVDSKSTYNLFRTGQGNPPLNCTTAFGGLGPLIINGLPYGSINQYKIGVEKNAPSIGDPGKFKPFLIQRSSAKYTAFENRDKESGYTLGKTCVGVNKDGIYLYVQSDGNNGFPISVVRNTLLKKGCKHGVFFDGSDSSLLFRNGQFLVRQGENKDETCTIGVLFK